MWLSRKTGKKYRLPSEAEWEYAARAGTRTYFWWGDTMRPNAADCDGCGSAFDDSKTAPVGSFKPNPFGLYDTVGNVTEWVEDQWHSDYEGAPSDGSAWAGDPKRRVMRSGSWYNGPARNHAGFRNGDSAAVNNAKIGFRIALSP
jgi:formylglycine-generating enzyme required for sulfatase activity